MATPKEASIVLLHRLGIPVTSNRVAGLVAFAAIEGGHWAPNLRGSFNPWNTTLRLPGSRSITPIGVQAYKDWSQGIEANAKTMAQSNMRAMIDALKRDADPQDFLTAVTNTAWCPGCDYTPFNARAMAAAYANKPDVASGGDISSGNFASDHPVLTALALIGAAGGVAYAVNPAATKRVLKKVWPIALILPP